MDRMIPDVHGRDAAAGICLSISREKSESGRGTRGLLEKRTGFVIGWIPGNWQECAMSQRGWGWEWCRSHAMV